MSDLESSGSGSSLAQRGVALIVLVVAGWILFTLVKGFLIAVFSAVLVVAAIIAVIWALRRI